MQYLLYIHVFSGTVALLAAAGALFSSKGKKLHVNAGRIHFFGMVGVFLTAMPMSFATGNIFLLLISVFSFYMTFSGRRFARNRSGVAAKVDWMASFLMLASGVGMWLLAVRYFIDDNTRYVVLTVFGLVALGLGLVDIRSFLGKTARGSRRISRHLTNMLGGTIAVVTAVLVVNTDMKPPWVAWILPTVLMTPVII